MRKNLVQGTGGFPRKRLVIANKKITRCASMAEHKRLRPQEDQLESRKSPHKDVSKRTQEKLEIKETTRRLRKQFKACASAQADVLRGITTNKNIKNWTLWGVDPSETKKNGIAQRRNR
jgi:hypothetical protein